MWGTPWSLRPGQKTSEMDELEWDLTRIQFLGSNSKNEKHHSIFSDTQHLKKSENPVFPKIFGPVDQPSLVGYLGPIQSNQDNKRPRKWRN